MLEAQLVSTPGPSGGGDDVDGRNCGDELPNDDAVADESLPSNHNHDEYQIGLSGDHTSMDDFQVPFAIDPILESLHTDSHVSSNNDSPMSNVWNTQLISLDQYEQLPNSTIMLEL